jgi:hypothetical protein
MLKHRNMYEGTQYIQTNWIKVEVAETIARIIRFKCSRARRVVDPLNFVCEEAEKRGDSMERNLQRNFGAHEKIGELGRTDREHTHTYSATTRTD